MTDGWNFCNIRVNFLAIVHPATQLMTLYIMHGQPTARRPHPARKIFNSACEELFTPLTLN